MRDRIANDALGAAVDIVDFACGDRVAQGVEDRRLVQFVDIVDVLAVEFKYAVSA